MLVILLCKREEVNLCFINFWSFLGDSLYSVANLAATRNVSFELSQRDDFYYDFRLAQVKIHSLQPQPNGAQAVKSGEEPTYFDPVSEAQYFSVPIQIFDGEGLIFLLF